MSTKKAGYWKRLYCLAVTLALALASGNSLLAQTCQNISGVWLAEEHTKVIYNIDGQISTAENDGSGPMTFQQTGCQIHFVSEGINPIDGSIIQLSRDGSVTGNTVTYTGEAGVIIPGATFSQNYVTGTGVIAGNTMTVTNVGVVSASVQGIPILITISGTVVFTPSAQAPVIATSSPLPMGTVGTAYNQTLLASGGTTPYTWTIASGSLPSGLSLSSGGVINGTPNLATAANFTVRVIGNDGQSSTKAFSLTVSAAPMLTLHRLTLTALDTHIPPNIDTPLAVIPNAALLSDMPPLGLGLVADGVTPVLFKLEGRPTTDTSYQIQLTPRGGYVALGGKLKVLSGGSFSVGSTLVLSPSTTQAFAYLEGLDRWPNSFGPNNEIQMDLVVTSGGVTVAINSFKLRPPPIVLIHGLGGTARVGHNFNLLDETRSDYWGDKFFSELSNHRPNGFVIPVEYGVFYGNPIGNHVSSLHVCAKMLDDSLRQTIENTTTGLKKDWAFTRYDVVGHSQGGVILRLLALKDGDPPFRSPDNLHRGRFDRIITVGSPHNGTLGQYYVEQLIAHSDHMSFVNQVDHPGNEKFNPFGDEIRLLNSPNAPPVDPTARFRAIRTLINGGQPPNGKAVHVYSWSGLNDSIKFGSSVRRGGIVFPRGSDGVVDYDSAGAGVGAYVTDLIPPAYQSISHIPPSWFFGVAADDHQTWSWVVASEIALLLDGPPNKFGPFVNPSPLPEARKNEIDALWQQQPTVLRAAIVSAGPGNPDSFRLNYAADEPIQGDVVWLAVHYGANGVDTSGFTVNVDVADSRNVSVTIDAGMIGDVVLEAKYVTASKQLAFAHPVRVASQTASTPLDHLVFSSTNLTLRTGQHLQSFVLGVQSNGVSRFLYLAPQDAAVFTSSDTNVVTVSSNGLFTAVGGGLASVWVNYAGLSATSELEVFPDNDEFATRRIIGQGRMAASNVHATKEMGEPNHAGSAGGHSVWFSWTAPAGGTTVVDTIGRSFDTLLAVYTNNSLAQLGPVASDNGSGSNGASRVTFNAVEGTEYQIAVDGFNGASGSINLGLAFIPAGVPVITTAVQINGSFKIHVIGSPGDSVVVERSFNLTTWTSWQTNTLPVDGLDITIPMGTDQQQFFRARLQ